MSEKTAQQQVREQFQVAETVYQNTLRTWNEMAASATEFSFDMAEKSVRYAQDLRNQSERNLQESMHTYRGMYLDGLKTWQGYLQGMGEMLTRGR